MKLVWCPDSASKAYIDVVKSLVDRHLPETNVAELVSAMAGGWEARLIVEAWSQEDGAATGLGLQTVAGQSEDARYVCVVPDEQAAAEYAEAMRRAGAPVGEEPAVLIGEAEESMRELEGVDMVVVDLRRRDAGRVLMEARPGPRGMVVVCKGAGMGRGGGCTAAALGAGRRVVRSTFLPIGSGVEVLHVGVGKGPSMGEGRARWIRHVNQQTKEEHVFRR